MRPRLKCLGMKTAQAFNEYVFQESFYTIHIGPYYAK